MTTLTPEAAQKIEEALEYAISQYGKPGGPWNVPSDPGGWISCAKEALALLRTEAAKQPEPASGEGSEVCGVVC